MDDIAFDEVEAEETLELKSPKGFRGASIDLLYAGVSVVLGRSRFLVKIDHVVNGGAFDASMKEFVLEVQVHVKVCGGVEIIFPAELVGIVFCFKPGRRFAFQVEKKGYGEIFKSMAIFPKALFPLSIDVEITDLVS